MPWGLVKVGLGFKGELQSRFEVPLITAKDHLRTHLNRVFKVGDVHLSLFYLAVKPIKTHGYEKHVSNTITPVQLYSLLGAMEQSQHGLRVPDC